MSVNNEGQQLHEDHDKYKEKEHQLQQELHKLYHEKNSHKVLQKRIEENENELADNQFSFLSLDLYFTDLNF